MVKRKNCFERNKASSKIIISLLALIMAAGLTACESAPEEKTMLVLSDEGSVSVHIAEAFDKPYYSQEELQQMVLAEAADYNRKVGSGNISVEKVAVEEGMAVVEMTYLTAGDYAASQNLIFFVGTPKEASDAGYDLNTVLSGTKDELETIGMSDMLAMEEYQLLITNQKETIKLNGKAAYVSDNVSCSSNLRTVTFGGGQNELAYVMYR